MSRSVLPRCVSLGQAWKPPSKPKKKMVYFVKLSKVVLDKDNIKTVVRCIFSCIIDSINSVVVMHLTKSYWSMDFREGYRLTN